VEGDKVTRGSGREHERGTAVGDVESVRDDESTANLATRHVTTERSSMTATVVRSTFIDIIATTSICVGRTRITGRARCAREGSRQIGAVGQRVTITERTFVDVCAN
jgi:hypothetical protein